MLSRTNNIIVLSPSETYSDMVCKCLENNGIIFELLRHLNPKLKEYQTLSELCNTFDVLDVNIVDYKIIQIVRNPLDRLVSSFLHHNKVAKSPIKFDNLIEDLVELKPLLPNNIDEFYEYMYEPNWILRTQEKPYFNYIRLWYEQSWYNDKFANVKTFKFEDIQKDIQPLADYIGINISEFPKEIVEDKTDYLSYYSNEQIQIVKELYKNDFRLFNY